MLRKVSITVAVFLSFVLAAILGYWFFDDRGRSWAMENKGTQCLVQPWAVLPSPMPQSKPEPAELFYPNSHYMPSWWKPISVDVNFELFDGYKKIAVGENGVWLVTDPYNGIVYYDITTKKVAQYRILDSQNIQFDVTDLYLANNGTLWVALSSTQPGGGYSALAQYRAEKDAFELVEDEEGLFIQSKETLSDLSDKNLGELQDGRLVVLLGRVIYLYDPITNQAAVLLDSEKIVSITVGANNDIWLVTYFDGYTSKLKKVNPKTGQLIDYGIPPGLKKQVDTHFAELGQATRAIAVDEQGRIWVSFFDRLEPDQSGEYVWRSLELSPVFVNTYSPSWAYRWANVYETLVSSNGNIWFASDIGIVQYDTSSDSWCLSARVIRFSDYPIAEGTDGSLWTVIGTQLYVLQR